MVATPERLMRKTNSLKAGLQRSQSNNANQQPKGGPGRRRRVPITDDMIREGFSCLEKTADGIRQAFLMFSVSGTTITDLAFLSRYKHLQKLELSNNTLEDLTHLSCMPHLVHLNVSGNKLTELLDIPEPQPQNLRTADFRINAIESLAKVATKLRAFAQLQSLALDINRLQAADGLSAFRCLLKLTVSQNELTSCAGLEGLVNLQFLDLSKNFISSVAPLASLARLEVLLVSHNRIASLDGVDGLKRLNRLDAGHNSIKTLEAICAASRCPLLGTLTLSHNPASLVQDYRLHVVYFLPQVTLLDSLLVDEKEKVHAKNLHGADADALKATRDKHFPRGELDDGGGAIPPIAAGLLPSDGKDGIDGIEREDFFASVDAAVDGMPEAAVEYPEGVIGFADWLERRFKTHLQLARAVYRFIVRRVVFPDDGSWGCTVKAPLFGADNHLEASLLQGTTGTWSERVAALFCLLAKACHLEAVAIPGYWRHEGLWPGETVTVHNHCWNAVKIEGRWRLLDCGAAALERGHGAFFNSPEHFRLTYAPLNAPWSLLRHYVTPRQFWAQPWCSAHFFAAGCRLLTPGLAAVMSLPAPRAGDSLPVASLAVAVPPGHRIEQRLLDASHRAIYPEEKLPWERPGSADTRGSRTFKQQVAAPLGVHHVETARGRLECRETQCFVALPGPGVFYHEAVLVKDLPGAMRCRLEGAPPMVLTLEERSPVIRIKPGESAAQYVIPPCEEPADADAEDFPGDTLGARQCALPATSPEWDAIGAQLLEPSPMLQLEADRPQTFAVSMPGVVAAKVVTVDHDPGVADIARVASGGRPPRPEASAPEPDLSASTDMTCDAAGVFSAHLVIPRVNTLEVLGQMRPGGPWASMLRFSVNPEAQIMQAREDLIYEPPEPSEKDQGMHLVRDIMRAVDTDGDGRLSRKEYLTKIRKDRKYADFLKMPPRIKEGDGTLQRFTEIFVAINQSRNGHITQNELAQYLGVKASGAEMEFGLASQRINEVAPTASFRARDEVADQ